MIKSTFKNRNQVTRQSTTDGQSNKFDPYFMVMLRSQIIADHNERFADPVKKIK